MKTVTIYALSDSREPTKIRYVGQTRLQLDCRLRRYWVTALAGAREHRAVWMRSVKAAHADVLIQAVEAVPIADADMAEIAHVAHYRAVGCDLTNRTDGGRGRVGCEISDETRQKMRESASRRKASPETRRKLSEGVRNSERHKAHLRRLHLLNSRPCTEVTRARISAALRGEGNGLNVLTWSDVAIIRERYAAGAVQAHLAREYGCSGATIHRVVHGHGWVPA